MCGARSNQPLVALSAFLFFYFEVFIFIVEVVLLLLCYDTRFLLLLGLILKIIVQKSLSEWASIMLV